MGSAATLLPPRLRCGQAFVEPFGWNGICGCKRARQHTHVPVSMYTCPSACKPREGADGGAPSVPVRASHLNSSQTPPAHSARVYGRPLCISLTAASSAWSSFCRWAVGGGWVAAIVDLVSWDCVSVDMQYTRCMRFAIGAIAQQVKSGFPCPSVRVFFGHPRNHSIRTRIPHTVGRHLYRLPQPFHSFDFVVLQAHLR